VLGSIGLATLGTIATDHTKSLTGKGQGQLSALTGGYHLSYVVAAAFVAVGIVAALKVLRPPVGTVQEVEEEQESVAFEGELAREVLAA